MKRPKRHRQQNKKLKELNDEAIFRIYEDFDFVVPRGPFPIGYKHEEE